jgi:hypothetical protein
VVPNQAKSFDAPEERREFENGHVDLVQIAGNNVGRIHLNPGWKWSDAIKPIAKTDSCQVAHVGYAIAGKLRVAMDDGTQLEINGGQAYELAPGHDAWVEGDEPYDAVEFESLAEYAKG